MSLQENASTGRGRQSLAGMLPPDAEAAGVDEHIGSCKRNAAACDRLLALLIELHPEHAPAPGPTFRRLVAVAPKENPAPSVVETTGQPAPETAIGAEACGVPPPITKGINPAVTLMRAASLHSGFSVSDVASHRHRVPLVRARHIAMYLSYKLTSLSFPLLARFFDGRDHTTIMHAVRKIERQIQSDAELARDVEAVRAIAIAADPTLDVDATRDTRGKIAIARGTCPSCLQPLAG